MPAHRAIERGGIGVALTTGVPLHAIHVPSESPSLPDGWPKPPPLPEEQPTRRKPPPKEEPEPSPTIEPPTKPLPDYEEPRQFSPRVVA